MTKQLNRLTKPEYACLLALSASLRSVDPHTKVGCAAFSKDGRTIGTSYNGLAPGMDVADWMYLQENRKKKALLFHHAEANLFLHISGEKPHILGLTHSPCTSCEKIIAASSTKEIYYLKEYAGSDGDWKTILDFYGVSHSKIEYNNIKNYLNNVWENF